MSGFLVRNDICIIISWGLLSGSQRHIRSTLSRRRKLRTPAFTGVTDYFMIGDEEGIKRTFHIKRLLLRKPVLCTGNDGKPCSLRLFSVCNRRIGCLFYFYKSSGAVGRLGHPVLGGPDFDIFIHLSQGHHSFNNQLPGAIHISSQ